MKAIPYRLEGEDGHRRYVLATADDVTHLRFKCPGMQSENMLPVQTKGARAGTGNWTWNGSTEAPTLKPSLLTHHGPDGKEVYHCWINDGVVQILTDSTHELAGQTLPLLEVEP